MSRILGVRFIDMTDHSDRSATPGPSGLTISKMDPFNAAWVAQHQLEVTDPGVIMSNRRAQTTEFRSPLIKPRIFSAAMGSLPIRPPLPSPEDIRSRIPPQGISPHAVSASFGNMVVGRGIFEDGSRRQQFWDLVVQNANYDRQAKRLSPLYDGAFQAPTSRPPLPSADDVRARISSEGIYAEHLAASYGDLIMGTGRYPDIERVKQIENIIHANAFLIRETMVLRLAPRMPSAADLRSRIPPEGITRDECLRIGHQVHGNGRSVERTTRFSQLILENVKYDNRTKLFFLKEHTAGASTSAQESNAKG